jgi:hypothetical protein
MNRRRGFRGCGEFHVLDEALLAEQNRYNYDYDWVTEACRRSGIR